MLTLLVSDLAVYAHLSFCRDACGQNHTEVASATCCGHAHCASEATSGNAHRLTLVSATEAHDADGCLVCQSWRSGKGVVAFFAPLLSFDTISEPAVELGLLGWHPPRAPGLFLLRAPPAKLG